jgi:hypothetical protein
VPAGRAAAEIWKHAELKNFKAIVPSHKATRDCYVVLYYYYRAGGFLKLWDGRFRSVLHIWAM